MLKFIKKYQLAIFFLLAFALTWIGQIVGYYLASQHQMKLSNEDNLLHFIDLIQGKLSWPQISAYLIFSLPMGPTVAGLIIIFVTRSKSGLKDVMQRLIRWKLHWRWYLIVFLLPLGLAFISLALGFILSGFQKIEINPLVSPWLFFPFLMYMIIFTGLAEEIGWRGYALPQLQLTRSAYSSSVILAIFWGLWHLPANLVPMYLQGNLSIPVVIGLIFALIFGIMGWTIVNTWLYNSTQSLFLIIILHGWVNTAQSYLVLSSNNDIAKTIFSILPWALAIYLGKRFGEQTLTYSPNTPIMEVN